MAGDEILFRVEDGVATVTFNRPEVHNAFNTAMAQGLAEVLDRIDTDLSIRALILTGSGPKSFVSGSDINELSRRTPLDGIEASRQRQRLFQRLSGLNVPSIAAINGYAFGGGLEIALSCTFRLAAEQSRMGLLEINLGLIPGGGGTQRLTRLVGKARAAELILSGKIITAEQAFELGIVNRVVAADALMTECREWASTFREKSPVAMKYALRAINEGMECDLANGLNLESLCLGACYVSSDSREGLSAFLEKRKPRFKGV